MRVAPDQETLSREFRSAGSLLMLYADHQVLKTGDADAIERLALRKRRLATLVQFAVVAWILISMIMDVVKSGLNDWKVLPDLLMGALIAAVVVAWLHRIKRNLANAATRLVTMLRAKRAK